MIPSKAPHLTISSRGQTSQTCLGLRSPLVENPPRLPRYQTSSLFSENKKILPVLCCGCQRWHSRNKLLSVFAITDTWKSQPGQQRDSSQLCRCGHYGCLFKIISVARSLYLCSAPFFFFPSRVPSAVVTRLHQIARSQRVQVLCCWQTLDEHTGKDFQLSLLSCKHKDSKTQKCYSLRLMYFYILCVHPCLMNRLCVTS